MSAQIKGIPKGVAKTETVEKKNKNDIPDLTLSPQIFFRKYAIGYMTKGNYLNIRNVSQNQIIAIFKCHCKIRYSYRLGTCIFNNGGKYGASEEW